LHADRSASGVGSVRHTLPPKVDDGCDDGDRTTHERDQGETTDHPPWAIEGVAEELATRTEADGAKPDSGNQDCEP
jgi:hypothetical protein